VIFERFRRGVQRQRGDARRRVAGAICQIHDQGTALDVAPVLVGEAHTPLVEPFDVCDTRRDLARAVREKVGPRIGAPDRRQPLYKCSQRPALVGF
jgi:hypothetical protein